jgi:hypothetical protein
VSTAAIETRVGGRPRREDWAAVGRAVRERMLRLQISLAPLARETGLAETIIRYIDKPASRHNRSTLVALSAVLGWRYDHLTNILHGEPDKNDPVPSSAEAHFENLLHAEVGPVKAEIGTLEHAVRAMDAKIDAISKRVLEALLSVSG